MREEVKHFDKTSTQYKGEYNRKTTYGYSFRVRRGKVLSLIQNGSRGDKVLDVGCGPGIMVKDILSKGYEITCIDPAPQMISLIKKDFGSNSNVSAEVGDVYGLKFSDNSFEVVIAMGLLEYLEEQDKAISELKRVLKLDGNLILTFPNKISPWRIFNRVIIGLFGTIIKKIKKILGKKPNTLVHKEYTLKEVRTLLEKNGLMVESYIYFNFKLIPHPFDQIFPKLTILQSRLFEHLDKTFMRFIGTGFIVRAKNRSTEG